MGTRGAMGVRIGGVDKIGYVQFDSYPDGWPKEMVKVLRRDLPALRDKAKALRVVSRDYQPTSAEKEKWSKFSDVGVSRQTLDDIYCLLRKTHGDLKATLKAGVVTDNSGFLADSLFCEYAYIANFDDNKFEIYRGFQGKRHTQGRYAEMLREGGKYFPVALVAEYPLDDIPKNWAKPLESEE